MKKERDNGNTTVIEENGHRVSITRNVKRSKGKEYPFFVIRANILGERKTQSSPTIEGAKEKAKALLYQLKAKGGIIATYTPQQVTVIEAALSITLVSRSKLQSISQAFLFECFNMLNVENDLDARLPGFVSFASL